jgi:threonine dehydrogenase-like Zn-dependent dehydrogenase
MTMNDLVKAVRATGPIGIVGVFVSHGPDEMAQQGRIGTAHGSPNAKIAQSLTSLLPDVAAGALMKKVGIDRLSALYQGIETVRRGGTLSVSGVYGGTADALPMLQMFDKGIQLRMGQAHVKRWIDDLLPLSPATPIPSASRIWRPTGCPWRRRRTVMRSSRRRRTARSKSC